MTKKHKSRRQGKKGERDDPSQSSAKPGKEFNPADLPDEHGPAERRNVPRPAPAPGVPVSERAYERLKDDARHRSCEDDVPAQEDRPRKEDK